MIQVRVDKINVSFINKEHRIECLCKIPYLRFRKQLAGWRMRIHDKSQLDTSGVHSGGKVCR